MTLPQILIADIETSLMLVRTFSLYPDSISHNNIVEDWHIICACFKWLGEDKVFSLVKDFPNDDKELCRQLREVLLQADIIVMHNGDKFDIKKLNARLIYHGLDPLPKLVTVDTLKQVKKVASFSSHRLDYLGQHLGLGGKTSNPANLWHEATDGDSKAIRQMVKYCKRDVELLEQVYLKLRPYFINHPNLNVVANTEDNCPVCQSNHLQKRGYAITRTGKYTRYQCKDCGSWSQGKTNLANVGVR